MTAATTPTGAARAGADPRWRWGDLVRGVPAAVWLLVALHGLLGVAYTVLAPTYRAPDEYKHVDLVLALADGQPWPGVGERRVSEQVYASVERLDFVWSEPRRHAAAEATFRPERPTFDELGGEGPSEVVAPPTDDLQRRRDNQLTQHPPLYYLLAAGVVRATPGIDGWAFDQVVGFLRLLGVVLSLPLPLLAFAAARRLVGAGGVAVAAAACCLAVPQLTHVSASVINDTLLTLAASVLTVLLVGVARGDRSVATGVGVGVAVGVALLTKAFAFALVPWVAVAYGLGWWRRGGAPPWRPVLVAGGLALVLGGWWWVRNLLVLGTVQPTGESLAPAPPDFAPDAVAYWTEIFWPFLLERWWGSFGWIDTPIPDPVVWVASAVAVVGVLAALLLRPRPAPATRRDDARLDAVVLLVPLAVTFGLVATATWRGYVRWALPVGIQGRYFFAGFVAAAVLVALGWGRLTGRGARWLPLAVLGAGAALHAVAADTMLGRYWGVEGGGLAASLRAVVAWSPWSGRALAVVALALAAVGVATVVALVRGGRARWGAPLAADEATA